MMTTKEKMDLLRKYNAAYRKGEELVPDSVYDFMLSSLQGELNWFEFNDFKDSLSEDAGDCPLDYVLGSLIKLKAESPEEFWRWIKKTSIKNIYTSEKIDGCSFSARYNEGYYVGCWSKGDGEEGTDWSEKGKYILPQQIPYKGLVDFRGEFTLINDSHVKLGYKTRRAGTVGMMNKDEIHPQITLIKPYVYQVLSHDMSIEDQFSFIEEQGFETPFVAIFPVRDDVVDTLSKHYKQCKKNSPYDIDGLVISAPNWKNENDKFCPEGKVAFKVNSEGILTTVLSIEWELSKGRLLKPVIIVEPTMIDGVTVGRVTGYNAKYINEQGVDSGAEILIVRSGEVIPKCVSVVKPVTCVLPKVCLECGSNVEWNGVELQCPNRSCGEVKRVESFIKSIGIENVSESSLRNWGILTFDDLLSWGPDGGYKSQEDFNTSLQHFVFESKPEIIMRHLPFDGVGTTLFDSLLKHVGSLDQMKHTFENPNTSSLPYGIGSRTLEKAKESFDINWGIMERILNHHRYKAPNDKVEEVKEIADNPFKDKKVLFTGSFSEKRNTLEAKCVALGATIASSVTKDLSILFCAEDSWNKSSKYSKAQKLGVEIKTEEQFWEMMK